MNKLSNLEMDMKGYSNRELLLGIKVEEKETIIERNGQEVKKKLIFIVSSSLI